MSWISGSTLHTSAKVFFFTSGHILHWLPAQYNLHNLVWSFCVLHGAPIPRGDLNKPTQENYSTSLLTTEMQIRTTKECHLTLVRIGVQTSNNTENNTLVRMQRNRPLSLTARKVAYASVLGKAAWFCLPQQAKHRILPHASTPFLPGHPARTENESDRYVFTAGHWGFAQNSREVLHLQINGWARCGLST